MCVYDEIHAGLTFLSKLEILSVRNSPELDYLCLHSIQVYLHMHACAHWDALSSQIAMGCPVLDSPTPPGILNSFFRSCDITLTYAYACCSACSVRGTRYLTGPATDVQGRHYRHQICTMACATALLALLALFSAYCRI